jgi:hypothetical protein
MKLPTRVKKLVFYSTNQFSSVEVSPDAVPGLVAEVVEVCEGKINLGGKSAALNEVVDRPETKLRSICIRSGKDFETKK